MKKKLLSMLLGTTMLSTLLVGCGGEEVAPEETNVTGETKVAEETKEAIADDAVADEAGSVYYLNFKPESDVVWQGIAAEYSELTGVEVKVVTAAQGTYEQTLKAEIAKTEAPTLFQVNGPVGYDAWKDYCADLSDTQLYEWLMDKGMALTGEDGGVYGIPYVVEGYGIIYNDAIMQKYFALEGAKATSMEEINNFDTLKAVAEDMTAKKAELEIEGVFASTSFATGDDWRWQTHLANIPLYYEYQDKAVNNLDTIDFTYAENFKNIFDLYINNSITEPGLLGSKSTDDSMAELALGKVAMVQNGNWGWGGINGVEGNVVVEEDIKFLPIYTGIEGEENQGLCTGTENFYTINSQASEADQAASIEFLEWLFSSEEGKAHVTNDLGFITPFSTFEDDEKPTDPLAQEVIRYMEDSSKTSVTWNFTTFPSQEFKNVFGQALLEYTSGNMEWEEVVTTVVDTWAVEKELAK